VTDRERVAFSPDPDNALAARRAYVRGDVGLSAGAASRSADAAADLVSLGFIMAAIRRGARLWVATALLGLVLGAGVCIKEPPAYQASASVLLTYSPDETPSSAILDNQAVAQSRTVAQLAMSKLGIRDGLAGFDGAYTVSVMTDRVLLFTVRARSDRAAVARANAIAAAFLQFRADQLEAGQDLLVTSLEQQVAQARQLQGLISTQISQLKARPRMPGRRVLLKSLEPQLGQANKTLTALEQSVANAQASTATLTAVKGSVILDTAAPLQYSRNKYLLVYAATGLIAGLVVALAIVVLRAVVSNRLRRRDDIARALGAPVKLSVGPVRLSRWRPGRRGLAAARSTHARRITAYLRSCVPVGGQSPAALAVVPVGDPGVAALSVAALALEYVREGRQVVLADLATGTPAARLLLRRGGGFREATDEEATRLTLAVPDRDDLTPAGPSGQPWVSPDGEHAWFTESVTTACAEADVVLSLATVDPSVGGDHIASWADRVVAVVNAGESSWTRIRAVGELVRLAGVSLYAGVVAGADKADESLGPLQARETIVSGRWRGPGTEYR